MSTPRMVEVREKVPKQNDLLARSLRHQFLEAGVFVVSFVSSPGSGKTTFLEKLLAQLSEKHRVAALVGDLATDNDATRLKRATPQVRQITTGTICHLDASMVDRALADWNLRDLDLLLIENVGNLVCPSSYDLGESMRFVLLSATEGEDKPLKYPTIFNTADVAIITKMDLAIAAEFDLREARDNIERVRPGMQIFEVSAKTGAGLKEVLALLESKLLGLRSLQIG
jgi:hydrogenase nickel incorporation protein HypB